MITKSIPNYSRYLITEDGVISNKLTTTVLSPDDRGRVKLIHDDGSRNWFKPLEEVADIFKPEPVEENPYTKEVFAGQKLGRVERVSTPKVRISLASVKAMQPVERKGLHVSKKLEKEDVLQIRRDYDAGVKTKKQIAEDYGIAWQTAGKICNRKIYQSIPEENGKR